MRSIRVRGLAAVAALALAACTSSSLIGEADDGGGADGAAVGPDAGPDDGCPLWLVPCGSACVDPFSDDVHCGACDRACGAGAGCVDGRCVPSVPTGEPPARCGGGGPAIAIGTGAVQVCAGALAATTFDRALSVCGDTGIRSPAGTIAVDGFDSRIGPYPAGREPGAAALTADLGSSFPLEISGELAVGGTLSPAGGLRAASLRAGTLALDGEVSVSGDAFVQAIVAGDGSARIDGTLHTPLDCAAVPAAIRAGACASESVDLEELPGCGELPIAEIVEAYADPLRNDDDEVGLAPGVLAGPGASGRIDLACGTYYLTGIAAGGPITIAVHGPTAIHVGGSILADAPIAMVVDPGASLDVFVAGTVLARAPLRIGSPTRPWATRLWVGGTCRDGDDECASDADCCSASCAAGRCAPGESVDGGWSIALEQPPELAALIAASEGAIVASAPLEAYGAIVAHGHRASGSTTVHFDRAAADAGSSCGAPPPCATAPECGGEGGCTDGLRCLAGCCIDLDEL